MITAIRPSERTSERAPAPTAGWARTPSSVAAQRPPDAQPRMGDRTGRFAAAGRRAAVATARRASMPLSTAAGATASAARPTAATARAFSPRRRPAESATASGYVVDPQAVAAALVERLLAGGALHAGPGRR